MTVATKTPRALPITVIDSSNSMVDDVHDHHGDEADGPRSLGQPSPCALYVSDTPISEAQIAQEMQHHRAMKPERSRADAARALVVRELLRREIERLGLAEMAVPIGRESDEEAGIRILLESQLEPRVPTADDCIRYYEQNEARFHSPNRIRVRHILCGAAVDDVDGRVKMRLQAEAMIVQIKDDPMAFTELAMRHSDCPSKDQGGDLGWLEHGQATPEFDRQVFRLRAGLAAFPVESRWGYHVVLVDEIAGGEAQAFEDVRERISDYLELQVQQREVQHFLQELQERYDVRGLEAIEAEAG
ncbi:MAG: peptidylprolyl isomerase [Thermomonas sp.]